MAAMPDTESDHHHDDAADVARLDLMAPPAAPATSSSSCDTTTATATATAAAHDEDEEEDGFTFAAVVDDSIPRLQDAADGAFFPGARTGSPVYPVFGRPRRSLSLPKQQRQQQDEVEEGGSAAAGTATVRRRRVPLGRLLLEDRWSDSAPSASGQQQQQQPAGDAAEAELDDGPADYCMWSPGASPARRRKSGSTGSTTLLRWRRQRRRVVHGRSQSDGQSSSTAFFPCKQDLVELVVSAVTCRRSCYLF